MMFEPDMRPRLEDIRRRIFRSNADWGDHPPLASVGPLIRAACPKAGRRSRRSCMRSSDNNEDRSMSKTAITTRGWTLEGLVARSDNLRPITRVSATDSALLNDIRWHESEGRPMVIEGLHRQTHWNTSLLSVDSFQQLGPPSGKTTSTSFVTRLSSSSVSARNIHDSTDTSLPLSELVETLRTTPRFSTSDESERLYGKDAHCPAEWAQHVREIVPSMLLADGPEDLLKNLCDSASVQTLMCYLGVGDTYTPMHKDLCASSGQNLMCDTENGGSSFWFMTESSDAPAVADYFRKVLGQELDHENHVATIEELAAAPFTVYVAEQALGDMVLVPPRSCHQVVNHGGITLKTSWSRMTVAGLAAAFYHELPLYRRVCRTETYHVMLTIRLSLAKCAEELDGLIPPAQEDGNESSSSSVSNHVRLRLPVSSSRDEPPRASPTETNRFKQMADQLLRLLLLFDDVLVQEHSPEHASMLHLPDKQDNITCDFCTCDIFQSFFECTKCVDYPKAEDSAIAPGYGLVICPSCYVDGRACRCRSMIPMQCQDFRTLLSEREKAAEVLRRAQRIFPQKRRSSARIEDRLCDEDRSAVFEAACILQRARPASPAIILCTPRRGASTHGMPKGSLLTCRKCRSGKCFKHILSEHGIHAVEAILTHKKGPDIWHARHKRKDTEDNIRAHRHLEQFGLRPDFRISLAQIAERSSSCIASDNTSPGWYDKKPLVINTKPLMIDTGMIAIQHADDTGVAQEPPSPLTSLASSLSPEVMPSPTLPSQSGPIPPTLRRAKGKVVARTGPIPGQDILSAATIADIRSSGPGQLSPKRKRDSVMVVVPRVPYVEAYKRKALAAHTVGSVSAPSAETRSTATAEPLKRKVEVVIKSRFSGTAPATTSRYTADQLARPVEILDDPVPPPMKKARLPLSLTPATKRARRPKEHRRDRSKAKAAPPPISSDDECDWASRHKHIGEPHFGEDGLVNALNNAFGHTSTTQSSSGSPKRPSSISNSRPIFPKGRIPRKQQVLAPPAHAASSSDSRAWSSMSVDGSDVARSTPSATVSFPGFANGQEPNTFLMAHQIEMLANEHKQLRERLDEHDREQHSAHLQSHIQLIRDVWVHMHMSAPTLSPTVLLVMRDNNRTNDSVPGFPRTSPRGRFPQPHHHQWSNRPPGRKDFPRNMKPMPGPHAFPSRFGSSMGTQQRWSTKGTNEGSSSGQADARAGVASRPPTSPYLDRMMSRKASMGRPPRWDRPPTRGRNLPGTQMNGKRRALFLGSHRLGDIQVDDPAEYSANDEREPEPDHVVEPASFAGGTSSPEEERADVAAADHPSLGADSLTLEEDWEADYAKEDEPGTPHPRERMSTHSNVEDHASRGETLPPAYNNPWSA